MTSPSPAAPAAPLRLCAEHGCGHRLGAHYSDAGGTGCQECDCGGFRPDAPDSAAVILRAASTLRTVAGILERSGRAREAMQATADARALERLLIPSEAKP